jgi:S-adenosylmethionine:tRNA ribosyltransferase-isomerase
LKSASAPDLTPDSHCISDYDYELPPEQIAQTPLARRDQSRLLVLEKRTGAIHHARFADLDEWLSPGDLLVANNSRVIPARLRGVRKPGGGKVEILLLRQFGGLWSALAKPARRLQPGTRLEFSARSTSSEPATAIVEETFGGGEVLVRFEDGVDERLEAYGEAPLPPYITESLDDADRYQTVYGRVPGSAAAPTAGLHFTPETIERLSAHGVAWTEVTLHVGLDTFRPVTVSDVKEHPIHREWCEVSEAAALAIAACRRRGGKAVAVGTTSARVLETLGGMWDDNHPIGFSGMTDAFIVPGHRWTMVDALVTNFHLPRSTLLLLVSALAGRASILRAYDEAIRRGYRFYSFGDAMLIV